VKGTAVKAVVVYQSLWGSTAAIARAIGEGLGKGTIVKTTTEATPDVLKGADLIVAGAPIHGFQLPSEESLKSAQARPPGPRKTPPNISHMLMSRWLENVPAGTAAVATFDTRVRGPLGRGGASRIMKAMKKAGYAPIAEPKGFFVALRGVDPTSTGVLLEGEVERARQWGEDLAGELGKGPSH
jgi:hypothetical protein